MKRADRYYNEKGEVGYIVSPEFGGGWFTANGDKYPDCATDPELIQMVLDAHHHMNNMDIPFLFTVRTCWDRHPEMLQIKNDILAYARAKWPDRYWDFSTLHVQWGKPGDVVKYKSYDGAETAKAYSLVDDFIL